MSLRQIKALGHYKMMLHQQLMQLEKELQYRFTDSEEYNNLSPAAKQAQQLLDEMDAEAKAAQEQAELKVKAIPTEPLAQMPMLGYEDNYGVWHPLPFDQIVHQDVQEQRNYDEVLDAIERESVLPVHQEELKVAHISSSWQAPEAPEEPVYLDQVSTKALLFRTFCNDSVPQKKAIATRTAIEDFEREGFVFQLGPVTTEVREYYESNGRTGVSGGDFKAAFLLPDTYHLTITDGKNVYPTTVIIGGQSSDWSAVDVTSSSITAPFWCLCKHDEKKFAAACYEYDMLVKELGDKKVLTKEDKDRVEAFCYCVKQPGQIGHIHRPKCLPLDKIRKTPGVWFTSFAEYDRMSAIFDPRQIPTRAYPQPGMVEQVVQQVVVRVQSKKQSYASVAQGEKQTGLNTALGDMFDQ